MGLQFFDHTQMRTFRKEVDSTCTPTNKFYRRSDSILTPGCTGLLRRSTMLTRTRVMTSFTALYNVSFNTSPDSPSTASSHRYSPIYKVNLLQLREVTKAYGEQDWVTRSSDSWQCTSTQSCMPKDKISRRAGFQAH